MDASQTVTIQAPGLSRKIVIELCGRLGIPFRERDLDAKVERFVVEWARQVPHDLPLSLRVCIDGAASPSVEDGVVSDAVHQHFAYRATSTRRQLQHLFIDCEADLFRKAFCAGERSFREYDHELIAAVAR